MPRKRRTETEEKSEKKVTKQKINRLELLQAIREVAPGIANKEIIEQSSSIVFDDTKIWSYNDQISISHNFNTGLYGAVKASTFSKLLEKMPEDEIEIVENKGKLRISNGNIKSNIKIDQEIKLTPIKTPLKNSRKWETLPNNFNEGINFTAFSASDNMIRPELCCVWITDDKIVSADSYRGTIFNMSSPMKQTFLLPAKAAVQLAKYNPIKVLAENGWLHFTNEEETVFSVRTYTDIEYPEMVWQFFKVPGVEITLPDGFIAAIERAEILITADFDLDRFIELIIDNNKIICRSKGNYGDFEEISEIEYSGEELNVKIHPALLSEILKHTKKVIIGEQRLLFENEKFSHTICLSI